MEDRTIARPDMRLEPHDAESCRPFNGGPDNCPARQGPHRHRRPTAKPFNGGPDNCPARRSFPMEREASPPTFNGGPDNCPARRFTAGGDTHIVDCLQWRAGQLPGQTRRNRSHRPTAESFNGGPDNCPARPATPQYAHYACTSPSMEGRTIEPSRKRGARGG